VHVDDAANAITSGLITSIEDQWNISKERLDRVRVYNLVDDDPSPRAAVEQYASWLRGRASQPELEGKFLPSDLSDEEKVVDNARAKSELGWKLMYPTFREGLEAIASLEISE
jgi:nucleoside-diphosphate-sugar epimerase